MNLAKSIRKLLPCVLLLASVCRAQAWDESYRLEAQGEYAAALAALEPVLASEPEHELARLRVAWLEYLNGDYNASIRGYRRALERNELSLEARLGMTLGLLAQQRWREAAAEAQAVLVVAPWNYYAHLRLMVAEEGLGQWQRLAEHARDVTRRYPSDPSVLVYLARAEASRGNAAQARAAYAQVLERIPGHLEAGAYLGQGSDR